MISKQIAIRHDLIYTGSKPSNENSTDVRNPFRLLTHYHQSLYREPKLTGNFIYLFEHNLAETQNPNSYSFQQIQT